MKCVIDHKTIKLNPLEHPFSVGIMLEFQKTL